MTENQKQALLTEWLARYQELQLRDEALCELLGGDSESPLQRAYWLAFDSYTAAVAKLVGDESDWLTWFLYENDGGKKGLAAGKTNRMKPMNDSLKPVAKSIELLKQYMEERNLDLIEEALGLLEFALERLVENMS